MNGEVDINSIDEAIDAIAFLIEEDKVPLEAISTVLKKFNITKEDLLVAFEVAFLCKPEEYQTICVEDNNWNPEDMEFELFDEDEDELDLNVLLG